MVGLELREAMKMREVTEMQEQLMWSKLDASSIMAYGQAIAERQQLDKRVGKISKELSDVKYALDRAAILAITDEKGIINDVNEKFCEISKYSREELIGKTHKVLKSGHHGKEFFEQLWSSIKAGEVWKGEIKNRAKDGTYYWVDTTIVPFVDEKGEPYQYLAIRFDITERKRVEVALRQSEALLRQQTQELEQALSRLKRTQAQLVQSEKMSSLGQLVAGVAHEINNPINFIHGNLLHTDEYMQEMLHLLQLYAQYYPNPVAEIQAAVAQMDIEFMREDLPQMLASMQHGSERIKDIVLSLRNFSRLDESPNKCVDIHSGIDSSLLILQHRLHGKVPEISVNKEYGKIPLVCCHASQLNQVFMNIISNAIDALENEAAPGIITITTKESQSKSAVVIDIADNGKGMAPEVQQRMFDPFFTTKPVGKGTGLGLSIAHEIVVEKHKGQLTCSSEPGSGTKFSICIPLGAAAP